MASIEEKIQRKGEEVEKLLNEIRIMKKKEEEIERLMIEIRLLRRLQPPLPKFDKKVRDISQKPTFPLIHSSRPPHRGRPHMM